METKPKTKMQMVREYLAEHPNATKFEAAEAVGCHVKLVELVLNPERYQRVIEYNAAMTRKRYHRACPTARHNVSRYQQWVVVAKAEQNSHRTKADAIREYTTIHPLATLKEVCKALNVEDHHISKAAPRFYNEKKHKPAPRPVPNTIAAMQREQDRLVKLMADAPTTAMYQELARQYSVLQMKIDYATAMANDANRELVRSRAAIEKRPLCQIVANGNGFKHH